MLSDFARFAWNVLRALLPYPDGTEEVAYRGTRRVLGAIRTVEVVSTPEDLAGQARTLGEALRTPEEVPPELEALAAIWEAAHAHRALLADPQSAHAFRNRGVVYA